MHDKVYEGIVYDDPKLQAEFESLVQRIRDAEQARQPIAGRHREAEYAEESGAIPESAYREVDDAYIAANNAIAAAQRAVDDFLRTHHDYRARS
jgi:hypothetical protein